MFATGPFALKRLFRVNALDPMGTQLQHQGPEATGVVSKCFATTEAVGWRWSHLPCPYHTEQAGFGLPGEKTAAGFISAPAFPVMEKK